MKVHRFADRIPQVVIKHIEEAGDIEIINLFETNNRTVVYYVKNEKPVTRIRKKQQEQPIDVDKGLDNGECNS
jgi:hypothetical protein